MSLLHYISSHSHIFESSGSVRVWESFWVKKKNQIKYASGKMLKTGDKVFWEYVFPTFSFITFRQFIALKDTFKVMNIRNCFLLYILHISVTRVYIHVDKEFNSFCGMLYVRMRRIYMVCFLSTSNLIIDIMTSFCISLCLYLEHNLIF